MKYWLILLMAIGLTLSAKAQDAQLAVMERLRIEPPAGYDYSYASSWSPDSSKLALEFALYDEGRNQINSLWHLYDVTTGELLQAVNRFIGWYQDGRRALVRESIDSSPRVIDVTTGTVQFTLEDTGNRFAGYGEWVAYYLDTLIETNIYNWDETQHFLHVYNAETGALSFSLENVTFGDKMVSPDRTHFAVEMIDTGVTVYDAANFSIVDRVDGYHFAGSWSPNSQQILLTPLGFVNFRVIPYHILTIGEGVSAPLYNLTSAIVWSPDGTRVAVGSDYTKVIIYDSHSGEHLQTIRGFDLPYTNVKEWQGDYLIGYSGTYAFTGVKLYVWDLARDAFAYYEPVDIANSFTLTGDVLQIFQRFFDMRRIDLTTQETLLHAEFEFPASQLSPDGRWMLAYDVTVAIDVPVEIIVYRADTLAQITTFESPEPFINGNWSPDNRYMLSEDGVRIVWEFVETE